MTRAFALVAFAVAAWTVAQWVLIVASGVPIGYGEGAVVHAGQILARGGDPYTADPTRFVSANYPPLGYAAVALGLPLGAFSGLRIANIVAAVAVALLVAWLARGSRWRGIALGASFVALYPVAGWTPGDRVDLLAVALTASAVTAVWRGATRSSRGATTSSLGATTSSRGATTPWWAAAVAFAGFGALALTAKPTALVPLVAVLAYLLWRQRPFGVRATVALGVASVAALAILLVRFDGSGVYQHLVVYNSFPYDVRNPALLFVLALAFLGGFTFLALRVSDGVMRAYVVGAAAVILLGGHEGATYNYLLDLAAASCVALAASRRRWPVWGELALVGWVLLGVALTAVLPFRPSLDALAARAELARGLTAGGEYYAEDSALLVAAGIEPIVDDSFVWARLVALGLRDDDVTPRVASRSFGAILSDVRLDQLDRATEPVRLRWPPDLVRAVLANYELERSVPGAYRYVPRR